MTLTFADSMEWWLEISPEAQTEAWQQSQIGGTSNRRWTAYLNQLCLNTLLPWIRAEISPVAQPMFVSDIPALWELVGGIAIGLDQTTKLVLLPGETIDDSELEIPQEWVDIPSWAAEYYLGVQVKLAPQSDSSWLRVWGYTTYQDLKAQSSYDVTQRMYYLDEHLLERDLNTFWINYELCFEPSTPTETTSLPELSSPQAENLVQRLGLPSVTFPRLEIPFTTWGALLGHPAWRQSLCQRRQPRAPIQLRQWFESMVTAGWQSLETLLGTTPTLATSFREAAEVEQPEVTQVKQLDWTVEAVHPPSLLVMGLQVETDDRIRVLTQIYSSQIGSFIPYGLTLSLCSEAGEVLQSVQARQQDLYIQLQFRCTLGTQFSLRISLDSDSFTEAFAV
jgi:hypothetical protein